MRSLRSLAAKSRTRAFSTREAAAITGVPLAMVNKYISRELAPLGIAVWGDGKRSLSYQGLIAIRMAYEYPKSLAPTSRAEVIRKALASPRKKHLALEGGEVIVRVDTARRVVAAGFQALRAAEDMVEVDAGVLGGEPCIKRTRIPVYIVAGIAKASGALAARRTYARLSRDQIEAARLFALAHPRRGRPKRVRSVLAKIKPVRSRTVSVAID
jgi:uncharacterized protein (DUF433 family)